ncbi:MAG: 16S rRNA (guanine(527)-N(7))-methyltransferase RsmG [Alphaproteobacteria bacterium]|nr:MAG: 16S rRNA (guanine(527)-N(7))-methyltransferase RsmG [Alphaproteobacteria bacterium]
MAFGPEDFRQKLDVSRETLADLTLYAELLVKWQKKINLISGKTLDAVWERHFLDSAQIAFLEPAPEGPWLDFGSGAGFPGLVVSLIHKKTPGFRMHLVESNGKKVAFLREVIRATGAPAQVHSVRMEDLTPFPVKTISARAVATVSDLLALAEGFVTLSPTFIFPKGQDVDQELTEASKYWNIDLDKYPSMTDPQGVILRIKDVARV